MERKIAFAKTVFAKLFRKERRQAVLLPPGFRFQGDRVRVRRVGKGVLLEPVPDVEKWFKELDKWASASFMEDGRNQPITPRREIF
jgi:antitoxin VapB